MLFVKIPLIRVLTVYVCVWVGYVCVWVWGGIGVCCEGPNPPSRYLVWVLGGGHSQLLPDTHPYSSPPNTHLH